MVDDFIRHILLSLCNKVITAKDRVLFFCQDIAQEPGNQLRVQEPDEANSVEEMGWKGGEKSLLFTFTLVFFMSCFVLIN